MNARIKSVEVGDSESSADLMLEDGRRVAIWLDGECCSQSFFEAHSVEELKGLVGAELRTLEHVAARIESHSNDVAYHALKVTTDKGDSVIDWRNESNGYYDGTLHVNGWEVANKSWSAQ